MEAGTLKTQAMIHTGIENNNKQTDKSNCTKLLKNIAKLVFKGIRFSTFSRVDPC